MKKISLFSIYTNEAYMCVYFAYTYNTLLNQQRSNGLKRLTFYVKGLNRFLPSYKDKILLSLKDGQPIKGMYTDALFDRDLEMMGVNEWYKTFEANLEKSRIDSALQQQPCKQRLSKRL